MFLTSNNPIILGEGNSNLPRIISIFGEALHSGVLDTEKKGIRETIKAIITQVQVLTNAINRKHNQGRILFLFIRDLMRSGLLVCKI